MLLLYSGGGGSEMKVRSTLQAIIGIGLLSLLGACGGGATGGQGSAAAGSLNQSSESVEVSADVVAVDTESGSIQVLGTDPGITVMTSDSTEYRDKRDGLDPFSLSDIQVGDHLKINARLSDTGSIDATRVVRTDATSEVELEGPVDNVSVDDLSFTILDVTIVTDDQTVFLDSDGTEISADEFFAALGSGVEVEVEGSLQDDGSILAETAMLLPAE
jgi:hypothetical protein